MDKILVLNEGKMTSQFFFPRQDICRYAFRQNRDREVTELPFEEATEIVSRIIGHSKKNSNIKVIGNKAKIILLEQEVSSKIRVVMSGQKLLL